MKRGLYTRKHKDEYHLRFLAHIPEAGGQRGATERVRVLKTNLILVIL